MISFLYYVLYFIVSFLPVSSWSHGVQGQPNTFLADKVSNDSEKLVSELIYRKLLYLNPATGEETLDLLDSYTVIEDGLVYEVTLKENQFWQDGVEITADDILYTASISKNLSEVSSDKINNYKVRFILPNKYSAFPSVLSLKLLPAHMRGKENDFLPLGSSKYQIIRVKKERSKVKEVVLINREKSPNFKKLSIKFYDNEESLLIGLKLREVNSIISNRDDPIEGFKTVDNIFFSRSYLLVFNTDKEYLNQENRRSLAKSIDYTELLDYQEYPSGVRPHGPLSGTWADSDSFEQISYDPNFNFSISNELVLVIPKVREAKLIADNITKQFKDREVGQIKTISLDKENYVEHIRDIDYDLVLIAQEYGLDPDRYVFWHSSQNKQGLNFSNYSSVRTDKSLEEGRDAVGIEERQKHYDIFQSVFSEESLATFIVHPAQTFFYSAKLKSSPDIKSFYPWEILNDLSTWEKSDSQVIF